MKKRFFEENDDSLVEYREAMRKKKFVNELQGAIESLQPSKFPILVTGGICTFTSIHFLLFYNTIQLLGLLVAILPNNF